MIVSRRHFMQGLSAVCALSMLGPVEVLAATSGTRRYVVGAGYELICYNLSSGHLARIDLGFDMHSASPHATNPDWVWALGKLGSKGALIDLKQEKVVEHFMPPAGMIFYGHCVHDDARDVLHTACVDIETRAGHIISHHLTERRVVADHKVCTGPVHDTQLLPNGQLLIATMDMKRIRPDDGNSDYNIRDAQRYWEPLGSSVAWLDVDSGQIVKRNRIEDVQQALTHMHLLQTGGMIAVSAPWGNGKGGAVFYTNDMDTPLQPVVLPQAVQDKVDYEFLSAAIDEQAGIAAVTNPDGRMVVFIDSRTGEYIDVIQQHHFDVAFDAQLRQFVAARVGGIDAFYRGRKNAN